MKEPHKYVPPENEMLMEHRALARAGLLDFLVSSEDDREYEVTDGVATICIDGPLMQKGGWWWEGYDTIQEKFSDALADPEVSAVVLKINSPGGVCSGCFSAVRAMVSAKQRSGKRVFAFADESAYSAAYALACVADEIYIPQEGGVGSIGVVGTLEDWSAFNERVGIKVAVVVSGAEKADGHPDVPLKPEVVARYQARIDTLATSFVELVSASRGVTTESIRKLEAACVYGDQALISNLADGIASFDDVLAKARSSNQPATTSPRKGTTMNASKTTPNTPAASTEAKQIAHDLSDEINAYDEKAIDLLGGTPAARDAYLANRKALATGRRA